jgi:hypothetical protein
VWKANAYVRAKLEVTSTADNVLVVRVIEMAIDDLLRECEGTFEPGMGVRNSVSLVQMRKKHLLRTITRLSSIR